MGTFGERSRKNLQGQHPDFIEVLEAAVKNSPIDFIITDGGRTAADQWTLWLKGRQGNPGPIVTYKDGKKNKSNHQAGTDGFYHAIDCYPYVDGKAQIQGDKRIPKWQKQIAEHILKTAREMKVKVQWGGNWAKPDNPHFEHIL